MEGQGEEVSVKTLVIQEGELLDEAVRLIRSGEVVAFPTETVYGLGADAMNEAAVRKIYEAKGRPSDNPLIIHIAPGMELSAFAAEVPEAGRLLMEAFWPGPLTLIFKKTDAVPMVTTGGLDTVAVRMPSHRVAQTFIRACGRPIAAPSANLSGRPSPTTAAGVLEDMDGRIPCLIEGGSCEVGLESTIVDLTGERPMILRPGGVTREMLEAAAGPVDVDPSVLSADLKSGQRPRAPGMKYKHYAPKGEMRLVTGTDAACVRYLTAAVMEDQAQGARVGLIVSQEMFEQLGALHVEACVLGSRKQPETMARHLFEALRLMDAFGCTKIYAEGYSDEGIFMAMMNRMLRASAGRVIRADEDIREARREQ